MDVRVLFIELFIMFLACLEPIAGKKVVREKVSSATESGVSEERGTVSKVHSLEIQHAFGRDGSFHTRGFVQINNLKTLSSIVSFDQEKLTDENLKLLENAAIKNDYYFLRSKRSLLNDSMEWQNNEEIVMTIISACALIKSSLKDRIFLHGDGQGNLISLSIMTAESVLDTGLDCNSEVTTTPQSFSTKVQYKTSKAGTVPLIQAFLQKQETEKAKKETEDNRSFFQKYWLYLVIGFVGLQLLMSAGGAGGGGGGGGS